MNTVQIKNEMKTLDSSVCLAEELTTVKNISSSIRNFLETLHE